ncbi:MAG: DUF4286 family protein [Bacteroidales bacterium]
MIIYNTTYHVDNSTINAFIEWVKGYYISNAVKSGDLKNPRLSLIMVQEDDENHKSYSLQFEVDSVDVLQSWYGTNGRTLVTEFEAKFAQKVVGFTTIMSVVEL